MAKTALSRMLNQIKLLTPDEQRQLREAIDQLLSPASSATTEEEFERELIESGILDEAQPIPLDDKSIPNWKPIDVKGKPLSETIVEERR